jgi:uncharacterized glyoxalase superfamily protein PhnB
MKFERTIPALRIFDEDKAQEFYVDFLEFKVDWDHRYGDDFPVYMQISKGDCVIHLSGHHGDACPGASILIPMDGIDDYQKLLRAKKYKHARPGLEDTDYGTREMCIGDGFGNRLTFFERIDAGSE